MTEQDPISVGEAFDVVGPQTQAQAEGAGQVAGPSQGNLSLGDPEGEAALQDLAQRRRYRPDTVIGNRAFTFSNALDFMKKGFRVQREGWNGKGMWICLGRGAIMEDPLKFWNPHTRDFAVKRKNEGLDTEVLPYFIMKTADDKILMGWLASQTDMVANDWQLVLG